GARVLDLHSHLLPALDDGARTLDDAVAMARAAAAAGVSVVCGTPHVRHDYPTSPEAMERALAALRDRLAADGVELDVRGGGELDLEWLERLQPNELARFGLGGNRRLVLLEFPYLGWPFALGERVFELQLAGITAVLAHPERSVDVQADPERLRPLVEAGAVVQLTAASLAGDFGSAPAKAARRLLDLELAHLVASDAHDAARRGFAFAPALERLGDPALARWLTEEVPAALLAGAELPDRPARRRRRRFGLGR
ncbi:MAG: tyrosine-protein phosphatase, partial [Gaiellaceae bacterium]